jgi:hypothetical protein
MAEVKVYYDQTGNTLTVWFGDPHTEHICEETGEEVVLMKDKTGRVIGFEKLNFSPLPPEPIRVAFKAGVA